MCLNHIISELRYDSDISLLRIYYITVFIRYDSTSNSELLMNYTNILKKASPPEKNKHVINEQTMPFNRHSKNSVA